MTLLQQLFNGSNPAAIFFDLDGTLVDSVPDLGAAIDAMLGDLSLPLAGINNVRNWVGNGAQKLVERALLYGFAGNEAKAEMVKDQAYHGFLEHYAHFAESQSALYPGVFDTLQQLKEQGVFMAVITNKPMRFTPKLLANFAIDEFFDLVLGGDSLPEKKPAALPLETAAKFFKLDVDQCLMIGDSSNDIQAAKNCGMKSVAVSYGYNYGDSVESLGADAVTHNLLELLQE
jgi:phosphoglycolate phosphatase